jgi:hypothetical protein
MINFQIHPGNYRDNVQGVRDPLLLKIEFGNCLLIIDFSPKVFIVN